MALVGDIQLQDNAVKPPALDTTKRFSAEGLTATTAFAVTDAGAGNTVSTTGLITAKSSNDISGWIQTTKADGNVSLYLSNDARPDWALKVAGSASDSFVIGNSTGANDTCQYPALSIGTAGAVGIGKYSASNALDISYQNSSSGGVVITEATNSVATKIISLATCSVMGTSTNHKLGFITNNTTVGMFDTSGNLGIGTEAPGATLDVRGGAIFNEAGTAVDFRIEGDTEANLFFVDGSTDRIGIGTATPACAVTIDMGSTTDVLLCVNGCICAAGYMGEKQGHTIEDSGVAETQRTGLNFVVTDVGCVVDDSSNDSTVVCINGANTCVPFIMADGSTSDPISLVGGSIGNQLSNDSNPTLGGLMCGDGNNICAVCCICITGCFFGDGSQLTGVSSVPSSFSGDCTIIGCDAGGNVAGGGANIVLIGANAGYNATTPSNIVVLGSSAALCMTTATDTVLIGTGAGRCVETCAGNVALGAWTLYNEGKGAYNTTVGTCAGLTQCTASNNTFVGAYAGTAVTTGSANVFVGYKAGCAATTGSCCLIIGNGTCDIITGNFNTPLISMVGCVGIGTAAPSTNLEVYGDVQFGDTGASSMTLDVGTASYFDIKTNTSDAADSSQIRIGGGGAVASTRGAALYLRGNEHTGTGNILLDAGDVSGGEINFNTAATERMVIEYGGNVGIGTTAPTCTLEVWMCCGAHCSTLILTNACSSGHQSAIEFCNGYGSGFSAARISAAAEDTGDGYLKFQVGLASTLTDVGYWDSDGNLGIGTAAPASKLHVNAVVTLGVGGSTNGVINTPEAMYFNIDSDGTQTDTEFVWGKDRATDSGGTELMRLTEAGIVGIGTSAPKGSGLNISTGTIATTPGTSADLLVLEDTAGNGITFLTCNTSAAYLFFGDTDSAHTGRMIFCHGDDSFRFNNAGTTESMRISSAGRVGIGTTSPDGPLHVFSASAGSVTADAGGNELVLENSDHVGMSFLSPNDKSAYIMFGDPDCDEVGMITYGHSSNNLDFYVNDAHAMRINSSQNVGVGTTAPDGKLHVFAGSAGSVTAHGNGDKLVVEHSGTTGMSFLSPDAASQFIYFGDATEARAGALQYDHDSNAMIFYTGGTAGVEMARIDSSGRVGIGNTAPVNELEVSNTSVTTVGISSFSTNAGHYPELAFQKSCHGSVNCMKPTAAEDRLGEITACGVASYSGGTQSTAGLIRFVQDGPASTSYVPGRIEFHTAGCSDVAARIAMAISQAGQVGIGTAKPVFGAGMEYIKSAAGAPFDISVSSTSDGDSGQIRFRKSSSATVDGTGVATVDGETLGQVAALGVRTTPAYAFAASIDFVQDGAAGATAPPGKIVFKTATSSTSSREIMHIASAGAVFIDNACAGTTNDCMSGGGLTINQGTNMSESFAIKGMSGTHCGCVLTEVDTTFKIQKYTAKGGAMLQAHQSDGTTTTFMMRGIGSNTASTTKSTGAEGRVFIQGATESGTSGGSVGTDGNVAVIADWSTTRFIFDAEGSGHADVEWTTFSDERLKSNIRDLPYGLDTAMALKPRIFTRQSGYISDGKDIHLCCVSPKEVQADQPGDHQDGDVILEDKTRIQIGLIAQEAELLIPELVKAPPDKYSFYSMDYERLSVVNLSAIQELNEKVVALEAQVSALQN